MSTFSYIIVDRTPQGITTITLNRPDVRNAFNSQLIRELTDAFKSLGSDKETRVIQLRGAGKVFCAGADMVWMKSMAGYTYEENKRDSQGLADLFAAIDGCPKPTVAVIQGGAYGGGVGLAAVCDGAIACETASFCLSETRLGILPAVISPYLIRAMGERQTRRLTLTAERFSAQEAHHLGLVHYVASEADLEAVVKNVTEEIIKGSPQAQASAKNLYRCLTDVPLEEQISLTVEAIAQARISPDGQEGLQAFLEKRAPRWF